MVIINKLLIIDKHCINSIVSIKISFSKRLAFILKTISASILKNNGVDKETENFNYVMQYSKQTIKQIPFNKQKGICFY